jgi:hypothetical protein
MEVEAYTPKTVDSLLFPLKEVRVIPICDTHIGAQGADLDRLRKTILWGVEHDCYFIGVGDYWDVASPSNRRALASITLYDSVREMMDDRMHEMFKKGLAIFKPARDRFLGLVTGDHVWEFGDGSTTDTRLAEEMGCKFMGDGAGETILKFYYEKPSKGNNLYATCELWYHHGKGWGESPVAAVNQLAKAAAHFYADCYFIAHQHKKGVGYSPWLRFHVTPKGHIFYEAQERPLVACGGYLKGYQQGSTNLTGLPSASYIEKKMLMPTALGGAMVFIRPRIKHGRGEVDVQVLV